MPTMRYGFKPACCILSIVQGRDVGDGEYIERTINIHNSLPIQGTISLDNLCDSARVFVSEKLKYSGVVVAAIITTSE